MVNQHTSTRFQLLIRVLKKDVLLSSPEEERWRTAKLSTKLSQQLEIKKYVSCHTVFWEKGVAELSFYLSLWRCWIAVIWRLDWAGSASFQDGSLTLLWATGLSSLHILGRSPSPHSPFSTGPMECSPNMAIGSPETDWQGPGDDDFHNLVSEVSGCNFCHILLVRINLLREWKLGNRNWTPPF